MMKFYVICVNFNKFAFNHISLQRVCMDMMRMYGRLAANLIS